MAEELSNQEQEAAIPQSNVPDLTALNQSAKDIIAGIESKLNLPAKPKAIEAYRQLAGNPLKGSNPAVKNPDSSPMDIVKAIDDNLNLRANTPTNPFMDMRPISYGGDKEAAEFERYYSTGDIYNKLGFSPFRDNETLYNNNMTFGDQFVRAAKQWDNLVGVGFMSGVRSWGTLFNDPLSPDMEGAREMNRIMTIGSSKAGGVGQFFTNTFLNSGYTIGFGAELLAENLALMGTGAAVKGAATALKIPSMLEKSMGAFKSTDVIKDAMGFNALEGVREIGETIPEVKTFWNSIKGGAKTVATKTADILNPLDNTIDALRSKDYATNYAKLAGTFGAFADDMLMIKSAVSEAQLEGGMTKINTVEDLIDVYRSKNGKDPVGEDLANIERIATEEAHRTAFWNLPAIVTSNKLLYATMLAPMRKLMGRETAKAVDDYIFSNKQFSAVGDDIISRTGAKLKSLAKPKTYGKFGIDYLTANFAEGIQENIQEAISLGASEHAKALFEDPIRAGYEGYMPHFLKGVKEQFSAQGAETFAGGLLMGAFAQPIMAAPSVGISKIIEAAGNREQQEELKKQREDVKSKTVETLNDLYSNVLKYLAPDLSNAVRTGRLSDDLFSAARVGDKSGALTAQAAIENNHIITALQTGKYDIIVNRLKDIANNFTKEEAAEAFKKYGIEEADVDKAMGHMQGVIARAEQIKADYEDAANNYPNPFNYKRFQVGTSERIAAEISHGAWEEAVRQLVFAKATYTSHSKRIADIANTFSKISTDLAKGDASQLMTLLNPASLTQEINTLRKEIGTLDETLPEQKKIKNEKEKQVEGLQKFYKAIENINIAKTAAEKDLTTSRAKEAFGNYLKIIAKKNDVIVFNESLDKAFGLIKDHLTLKNEMSGLANSINVLMTPQSFFQVHKRLFDTITSSVNNKPDTLSNNLKRHEFITDLNEVFNKISNLGFVIPDKIIDSYIEAYDEKDAELLPPAFFKDTLGNKISSGEKYDKAINFWNEFVALSLKRGAHAEAMDYDPENYISYPVELKKILEEEYNTLTDEQKNGQSLEEWATSDQQKGVRNYYFQGRKEQETALPEKYRDKNFSIDQLQQMQSDLEKELEQNPNDKLEQEVRALEDYIAYRKMALVTRTMPQSQRQAFLKMKADSAAAQSSSKEDGKYVIEGKKYDTRVTTVENKILEEEYGVTPTSIAETKDVKQVLDSTEKLIKNAIEEGLDKNLIVNMWVDAVKNKEGYKKRFDDSKIPLIKEALKQDFTYEDFVKAIASAAYEESRTGGNTIDELTRNFLSGTPLSKPFNMSEEAFKQMRSILHGLMKNITERKEIVLAKNLIVTGEVIIDGVKQSIAGELDILVVTPEGHLKIYDLKSGRQSKWEDYGTKNDKFKTKEKYAIQLSLYKRLIEEKTGLKIEPTVDSNGNIISENLRIIPIAISVDTTGYIKSAELSADMKNIEHSYQQIVEKYIPVSGKPNTVAEPFVELIEETSDKDRTELEFETIGKYNISKPVVNKDGEETITVENPVRPGKGMTYIVNTDENGSVISLTPKNNLKQNIVNEKLLVAVEIKRNKYEYNSPIINNIAKDEEKYNKVKELLPAVTVLENTLNLGLDSNITSALNNLYANKPLDRASLIAIQLWANSAAKRLDSFLENEYKDNPEFTKAWENMYLINELVEERLNALDKELEEKPIVNEPAVKKQTGKSTDQLLRERDKELKLIQEKRKELGIEFDPLDDVPMSVVITMDRFDNNLPIDPVALSETSNWLYNKYKEIDNMLLDPKRMLTQTQIKQYKKALEKDITALENYKQEQYGEKIIQNEVARSTDTRTEKTRGTVSRDKNIVKKTSFDEPIKEKTKKHREVKVKKAVEKAAKEKAIVTTEIEEELFPKVYTIETINADLNLESLKEAKSKKFEVIYKGNRYKIKRVGKNSVTLSAPTKQDVNIKSDDIKDEITVVEKGTKKATIIENDTVAENQKVMEQAPKNYVTGLSFDQLKNNFLNNIC